MLLLHTSYTSLISITRLDPVGTLAFYPCTRSSLKTHEMLVQPCGSNSKHSPGVRVDLHKRLLES